MTSLGVAALLLATLSEIVGAGCTKKEPAPSADTILARATPTQAYRFPAPRRLVAIGDLHGDLTAAKRALVLAGAVDAQGAWIGGDLVVVQTGDELDRGDDDRALFDYLDALTHQAAAAGGALHLLNGNHELMNVAGDFRYVSLPAMTAFADGTTTSPAEARRHAFAPGGPYAHKLAERNVVEIIGTTVFVHGGILPSHVQADLGRINEVARRWMRGTEPQLPAIAGGPDSPVWLRTFSDGDPTPDDCATLEASLAALGARRLVVGHTIQSAGINPACAGHVWRIDVGLSRVYPAHPSQVLEIAGDAVRPIVEKPSNGASEIEH